MRATKALNHYEDLIGPYDAKFATKSQFYQVTQEEAVSWAAAAVRLRILNNLSGSDLSDADG